MGRCLQINIDPIAKAAANEDWPNFARLIADAFHKLEDWAVNIPPNDEDMEIDGNLVVNDDMYVEGDIYVTGDYYHYTDGGGEAQYEAGTQITITGDEPPYTINHDVVGAQSGSYSDTGKVVATVEYDAQHHLTGATFVATQAALQSGTWVQIDTGPDPDQLYHSIAVYGDPDLVAFEQFDSTDTKIAEWEFDSRGHFVRFISFTAGDSCNGYGVP